MTEIEQKALELINEVTETQGWRSDWVSRDFGPLHETLCRAIEQHEAFRQEVSDAVAFALKVYGGHSGPLDPLRRFIITKPDPLAEALDIVFEPRRGFSKEEAADAVRAALAKRGLEIREKK